MNDDAVMRAGEDDVDDEPKCMQKEGNAAKKRKPALRTTIIQGSCHDNTSVRAPQRTIFDVDTWHPTYILEPAEMEWTVIKGLSRLQAMQAETDPPTCCDSDDDDYLLQYGEDIENEYHDDTTQTAKDIE